MVGRGLVIVPKLIHPLPPPLHSPESSPEHVLEDTWMQVRSKWTSVHVIFSCGDENSIHQFTWNSSFLKSGFVIVFIGQPIPIQAPPAYIMYYHCPFLDWFCTRSFLFTVPWWCVLSSH